MTGPDSDLIDRAALIAVIEDKTYTEPITLEDQGWNDGITEALRLVLAAPRAATEPPPELREAAQRLCDAIADQAAIRGLGLGWKAEMDADDAQLCALQDTRTALDGRERPHVHKVATPTSAPEPES